MLFAAGTTMVIGGTIMYFLNKRLRTYKVERAKSTMEYDRGFIRAIQSRLEITQNLSFEKDLAILDECNTNYWKAFRKQMGIQMLMFQGSRVLSFVILIALYWILGHQYLDG